MRKLLIVVLVLSLLFTACSPNILEYDAKTLQEKGYMKIDNKNIALNSELKSLLDSKTYEFDHTPTILIYHTHAREAFLMDGDYQYDEIELGKTLDSSCTVVHVGDVLADELRALGFNVIHDTTDVEGDDIFSAYSRSLEIMEKYDNIDIYLDLHRDAANIELEKDDDAIIDGKRCAKMFFVVGTGIGTYDGEYDVLPDWQQNYIFASSVSEKLSKIHPELSLPTVVKVGRHNQHVGLCLLAELGHNANTMEEVLNSVPYFAKSIKDVCKF